MNDPCGLIRHGGLYHLYYQYNPTGGSWGNIHWGHATSADLCRWVDHGVAIKPHPEWGHPFTGSIVKEPETGHLVALFTAARPADGGWHQEQALAISGDGGFTWTWDADNPVLENPGLFDFRDPRVVWLPEEASWMMVLAAGDRILLYRSRNLRRWEPAGEFGSDYPEHRGVWECPDLVDFGPGVPEVRRWALVFSIGEGMPGHAAAVHYVLGRLSADGFDPLSGAVHGTPVSGAPAPGAVNPGQDVLTLDAGPDFYAFQSWTGLEEPVGIAWANNYAYAHTVAPPASGANGMLTLPRRLRIMQGRRGPFIASRPAIDPGHRSGLRYLGPHASEGNTEAATEADLPWDSLTWYRWEGAGPRQIVFREGEETLLMVTIDYEEAEVTIRREAAALKDFAFEKRVRSPVNEGGFDLLVQRGLVELFAFGGGLSVSLRLYPVASTVSLTTRA